MKNQQGSGLIITLILLLVMGFLAMYVYNRYQEDQNTPQETTSEAIEKAKENVDKANEAQKKADEIIDIVN